MARTRSLPPLLAGILALGAVAALLLGRRLDLGPATTGATRDTTHAGVPAPPGRSPALLDAIRTRARDRQVEVHATVSRVLPDDREGSPHQRFLIRVGESATVLIAHNIALAPRVPLRVGDTITISGEYEWTPKGGTIHWTHLDPARRHAPGYIEHDGHRYQ